MNDNSVPGNSSHRWKHLAKSYLINVYSYFLDSSTTLTVTLLSLMIT